MALSCAQKLRLPTETWAQIFSYLSRTTHISLLHVSRKFHDMAMRYVFAAVRIYFVAGQQFTEAFESYPYFFADMEIMAETMMRRSWEILAHMSENPGFARVVKTLTVIAYADSPSVFEILCLKKALQMTTLRAFYWFGRQPEIPCEVTDCLPLQLQSLNLQSVPPKTNQNGLNAMQIQRLQLETLFHIPPRMHSQDPDTSFWVDLIAPDSNVIATFGDLWSPQLCRLSLLLRHIDRMPVLKFSFLTELELCVASDHDESEVGGIDLVLHHVPLLESLSLVGYRTCEIYLLLPSDPSRLPNLNSFRLSAQTSVLDRVNEPELLALSRFLDSRHSLRRLSLHLGLADWDTIALLLPSIRRLSALEVFGLHAGVQTMDMNDFQSLASIITPKMTAIQLAIPWNYADTVNVNVDILGPLIQRLQELPRLRFIHLYSIGRIIPIDPDDLVSDLIHLDTLGYNRCLWDVHERSLVQWKPWRVQYAIEEDFLCLDDAWLFRHI